MYVLERVQRNIISHPIVKVYATVKVTSSKSTEVTLKQWERHLAVFAIKYLFIVQSIKLGIGQ